MSRRKRLPQRRPTETFTFEHGGQKFHATVGFYDQELTKPGELFLNGSQKSGSATDLSVSEAAIGISIALQYGCPIRVLREAVLRTSSGDPSTPVGQALDIIDNHKPLQKKKKVELHSPM